MGAVGKAGRRPGAGSPESSADPSRIKGHWHWRRAGLRGPSDCGSKVLLYRNGKRLQGPREPFRVPQLHPGTCSSPDDALACSPCTIVKERRQPPSPSLSWCQARRAVYELTRPSSQNPLEAGARSSPPYFSDRVPEATYIAGIWGAEIQTPQRAPRPMLLLLEVKWRVGFTDTCVGSGLALVSSSQSRNPPYFGEVSMPRLPIAYGFGGPSSRDMAVDVDQLALGVRDEVLSFVCTPGHFPWYISTVAAFKISDGDWFAKPLKISPSTVTVCTTTTGPRAPILPEAPLLPSSAASFTTSDETRFT